MLHAAYLQGTAVPATAETKPDRSLPADDRLHVGEPMATARVVLRVVAGVPGGGAFHVTNLLDRVRAIPGVITARSTAESDSPLGSRSFAAVLSLRIARKGLALDQAAARVAAAVRVLLGVKLVAIVSVNGQPARVRDRKTGELKLPVV